jgi:predicted nucleic acid-binding protein
LLFWDACALAKRYFVEVGNDVVDALFDAKDRVTLATTAWGYLETFAILLRKRNGGLLSDTNFKNAVALMQGEVLVPNHFLLLVIPDSLPFDSTEIVARHNLNATDAVLLTLLMELSQAANAPECIVVSADKRLVRAAQAEGFKTIDPEALTIQESLALLPSP